jgi:hypothetical protein
LIRTMKSCATRSSHRTLILLWLAAALLSGCAASGVLSRYAQSRNFASLALHSVLDRSEEWRSLSARVRLKMRVPGARANAIGHLMFLAGERFEVGFVKPYDRFLGNFYVTPTQFVYWDLNVSPSVFGSADTLTLSRLIPADVPNWDPRDLLPFPVSGRTGGFQTDSIWRRGTVIYVSGRSGGARHTLMLSTDDGRVLEESVERAGRDSMVKRFSQYAQARFWPIARRVVCSDSSGLSEFTWTLSGIALDADDFQPARLAADSGNAGTSP